MSTQQPVRKQVTQADVLELFDYHNGNLSWRVNRSSMKAGQLAGHLKSTGYMAVRINNKEYKAHRIIYLWHHGYLPDYIDHIDGNRSNNKVDNLRPATTSQNNWNSKRPRKNTSGVKGVCWCKRDKKWLARVQINGKQLHLGYFNDINDAEVAIRNARGSLTMANMQNMNKDTALRLAQECADYATSLRSAANVAKLEGRAPPVSFLRAADLFERAASRITELDSQLAQRFDAADVATAAQPAAPARDLAAVIKGAARSSTRRKP